MANRETTKATSEPIRSSPHWNPVMEARPVFQDEFQDLVALAPNMTGIAIKKENSVATKREQESSIAPKMVEPEREVPGMIAKSWRIPMQTAVR